jgi:predicted porin
MRKIVVAMAVLVAGNVYAQSNDVTIYGVFDSALRYQNHDALQELVAGQIQGSRLGFKGTEIINGDLKAIFNLEAGLNPATGASGQQGQLFGRQAWVGLAGQNSQLILGRQFGVAFDIIGADDPYGIANASSIAWQFNLFGARFDNTIKYKGQVENFSYEAAYSFGEKAGNSSAGRTVGLGAGYTTGALAGNAAAQQSTDINGKQSTSLMLGGSYTFETTKFFAAYINTKRDQNFQPCSNSNATSGLVCQGGPLANTNLASGFTQGDATTNYFQLGLSYRFSPAWEFVAGYMDDETKVNGAASNASHKTAYAVLDYYLSKRTDIYGALDYNEVAGSALGNSAYAAYAGKSNQSGVTFGLRHRF